MQEKIGCLGKSLSLPSTAIHIFYQIGFLPESRYSLWVFVLTVLIIDLPIVFPVLEDPLGEGLTLEEGCKEKGIMSCKGSAFI